MIRVLLVDKIPLTCNAIAAVLQGEPDVSVIGCASHASEALIHIDHCDIALVSTNLGGEASLALVQAIKETAPSVRILILGLSESKQKVLQYVQAGAAGYVLPDDSVEGMLRRIRSTFQGQAMISPQIAAALMQRINELARLTMDQAPGGNGAEELTPRELEILELIGQGLSNRDIADRLVIEVGTVKNHVHSILHKLDVNSRQDAADYLILRATSKY